MQTQEFKNHIQLVPFYHFVLYPAMIALLIGAAINLNHASKEDLLSAFLLVLGAILLIVVAFYSRSFALRAQDRAIRSEENFRYYIATGKQFDSRLTIQQIIALRFAGDDEFVALAKRAVEKKMTSKEIKMAIKNWKGDYYRV